MAKRMAALLDDVHSSDDEFEPAPPNPFTSLGARSMEIMIKEASDMRSESKKASKQIQTGTVSGAPSTRYYRARWANLWHAFYTEVLQKSIDTMPTARDLERFLLMVPRIVETSSVSRTALSWGTMEQAFNCTVHAIRCRHDGFNMSYGDQQRFKDVFETLRQQGKITKDPTREDQWVGIRLVTQLIRGLLVNAIQYGVTDWSIVVHKCLGLAMQSALSCRAGDAVVSRDYEDNECILFKDILIKVVHDRTDPDDGTPLLDRVTLHARVTLKHTKGKKRDLSNNHTVALQSLDDVEYNVVDPLKLLLVHALRQGGIVGASSAHEAVQQALARRDNLIQWKYPDRPILCAIIAHKFDFSRGARIQQLRDTLDEAAAISGIGEKLVPHDIRRGAAREHAQLPRVTNMELAAEALDHSNASMQRGVTKKYVGCTTRSTLSDRINLEPSDPFALEAFDIRHVPSHKRRRLASAEIDGLLSLPEYANMDNDKRSRHTAGRAIKRQKAVARPDVLYDLQQQQLSTADAMSGQDTTNCDDQLLEDLAETMHHRTALQSMSPNRWSTGTRLPSSDNGNNSARIISKERSRMDDDDETMDDVEPMLLRLSGIRARGGNTTRTAVDYAATQNTQAIEAVLDELMIANELDSMPEQNEQNSDNDTNRKGNSSAPTCVTAAQVEMQQLEAPASVFLPWLSRVNTRVINDSNPKQHENVGHLRGGSRDEMTFFVHHCKYESVGCTFSSISGPGMIKHEAACTPERRSIEAAKTIQLSYEEADCSYVARGSTDKDAAKKLKRHQRESHEDVSLMMCPIGGRPKCATPLKGPAALAHHKTAYHRDIVPQQCPVDGCRSKTSFDTKSKLDDHLRGVHHLRGTELSALTRETVRKLA